MKILELFSGTGSFSKVAKERGHQTWTIDYNEKFKPNQVIDMIYFNHKMLPKEWRNPDIIWASPPCETFSLSGNSIYMGIPTKSKAYIGMALVYKTIETIRVIKPKHWIIENPRAGLRNVWFMRPLPRTTVTYCQYGERRMKPTDIWNNIGFIGKTCKNGDKCHEPAPRGSCTGTQGEMSTEHRSIIPRNLCLEIIKSCEKLFKVD
jgi:hypothetical protein